jgi:UDP-glucose 4-epimerase
MNILVTGGGGFIGSHVAERLLRDGHQVVIIDNNSTGSEENAPAKAAYVYGDVTRKHDLVKVFQQGFSTVCHIAGHASNIRSYSDPLHDLRTNVEGTINVVEMCIQFHVPRLLYASSMTVYGDTSSERITEEIPCSPISYYGISKYAAERYVLAAAARPDLDFEFCVTSFRMFTVYGPRQALDNPYQGVLSIFIGNQLLGRPLTIYGDGNQVRDFVYVADVAEAWARALDSPAAYGRVINLGSGHGLTINQLSDAVLSSFATSDRRAFVRHAPARPGEQRHVVADISKGRLLLGWEPKTSFKEGLTYTLEWARTQNLEETDPDI